MTKKKSSSVAQMSRSPLSRSLHGARGPAGKYLGRTQTMAPTVSMYIEAARMPGTIPAMNSLPMSCSVMMP